MVERSLSMREVRGSIPRTSILRECRRRTTSSMGYVDQPASRANPVIPESPPIRYRGRVV